MRAVVRVFLAFPTKSIGGSLTFQELSVRKLFIFVQRSFFPKFEIIRMGNPRLLEKKTPWPRLASGIKHVPECKKDEKRR